MKYFKILLFFCFANYILNSQTTSTSDSIIVNNDIKKEIAQLVYAFKCKTDDDCSGNGFCSSASDTCHCDKGFTTYLNDEERQSKIFKVCNYEYKSQLTAFLLSLFVGFTGAEHFYLENTDKGITKLCFSLVCCLGNIFIFIVYKCFSEEKQYLIGFVGLYEGIYLGCGFFFMCLWMLFDLIKIGKMEYSDGYGFSMIPW